MVKRATQVEQDILDGAIERAVQDLASRSGLSAEVVRQMATDGTLFVPANNTRLARSRAAELNRGMRLLREALAGTPRAYWVKWYSDKEES